MYDEIMISLHSDITTSMCIGDSVFAGVAEDTERFFGVVGETHGTPGPDKKQPG